MEWKILVGFLFETWLFISVGYYIDKASLWIVGFLYLVSNIVAVVVGNSIRKKAMMDYKEGKRR